MTIHPQSYTGRAEPIPMDRLDGTVQDGALSVDQRLWARLLTGELNPDIKTLATRLIVTRLRIEVANGRTDLPRAVQESSGGGFTKPGPR